MDGSSDAVHLAYVRAGYAALVVVLLLLGMHIFMVVLGTHLYLYLQPSTSESRELKRSRLPYTVLSWVILVLCSVGTAVDLKEMEKVFILPKYGLGDVVASELSWWSILGGVCILVGNLLGDGLLLYRCYLVWQDIWWVMVFPAVTFLAFVAQGIAFLVTSSAPGQPAPYALASAWYILSAVFNITVTGLIVGRLMHARYQVSKLVTLVDMRLYTGPVAILVESALPLCLAAIAAAIVNLPHVAHPAGSFFTSLWIALSSFCPQLIIFRVASGHSYTGENVVRSLKLEDFETLELRANSNSDYT
ncbi:hypothetical protein CC2G_013868 [Coprinopsis cinerea AmutBmut pab1-1]|nr:hypothetical protein CC2G_013868 [Coprinopsis cinerea AmutBmut pab1-1]